jgi:hypothetical protein
MVIQTPACPNPIVPSALRGGLRAPHAVKNLESITFDLHLLQPIEIPQNHQDILWKSLALEPQKFGKACKKFGN